MTPLAHLIALPIRAYRLVASPWVGHGCRFLPSCSAYALEALEQHGGMRGGWLTARRICRCHPWGGQGHDPVPSARPRRAAGAGRAGPGPEDDGHALTAGADDERA